MLITLRCRNTELPAAVEISACEDGNVFVVPLATKGEGFFLDAEELAAAAIAIRELERGSAIKARS